MTRSRILSSTALSLLVAVSAGCGSAAPSRAKAASGPSAPPEPAYAASSPAPDAPKGEAEAADAPAPAMPLPAATVAVADASPPPPPPPSGGAMRMGSPGLAAAPSMAVAAVPFAGVKAGEWDDNANYREFGKWLGTEQGQAFHRVDVRDRQFIVVRDVDGKAVPRCPVTVTDPQSQRSVTLTTTSNGRAILFPHAEGLAGDELSATAHCQNATVAARFSARQSDGVVDLKLGAKRALAPTVDVDIAFFLDTTGSMSEEITAVKATIQKVAGALGTSNARVRVGLVEYKDRTDAFVTKLYPMTTDVRRFSQDVASIEASGGGDTPEDACAGLHAGLTGLDWSGNAVVKLAFLIGDAPPHLDYANGTAYEADMRDAAHRGIQVYTVAASGMDDLGQVVWRQIAQYTGATNLFVLRGGAGPQSTGGGDPKSSCGGTQGNYASGNLDALILQKVKRAVGALERDPLQIAGLRVDEDAKPCAARLKIAE